MCTTYKSLDQLKKWQIFDTTTSAKVEKDESQKFKEKRLQNIKAATNESKEKKKHYSIHYSRNIKPKKTRSKGCLLQFTEIPYTLTGK